MTARSADLTIFRNPDGTWSWRCWLEECAGETKQCHAETVLADAEAHYDLWHTDGRAS